MKNYKNNVFIWFSKDETLKWTLIYMLIFVFEYFEEDSLNNWEKRNRNRKKKYFYFILSENRIDGLKSETMYACFHAHTYTHTLISQN